MSTSVANVVSHFPTAQNGFTTTTSGSTASGAATVGLNSVAGYTNGQPAVFVIEPTSAAAKQTFTGIIDTSGVQVTSVVWTAGTNQTHALGVTIVDYATATHIAMISKGIGVTHEQSGLNKADMVYPTPRITTSINDTNGNEIIKTPATGSAVNEITVTNAAAGNDPLISATGGDTDIDLDLRGKGVGTMLISSRKQAITTNSTATGLRVEHGWGFMNQGGATNTTSTITFPTAFSSAPNVSVSIIGTRASDPVNIGDLTGTLDREQGPLSAESVTTSQVLIRSLRNTTATNFTANQRLGFTWIAIGAA